MRSDSGMEAVDRYLDRLRKALGRIAPAERDEIVEEIRTHVLERVEAAGGGPDAVEQVLRAVGEPKALASQYRTDAMLRRAALSRSPWLLLRATLRWAGRGATGLVALFLAVAGYGSALVCYVCALLKPLFPSHIGVWLAPEHTLTVGYWSGRLPAEIVGLSVQPPASLAVIGTLGPTAGPVRELLGPWLIPAGIVCGFLVAFATHWSVQRLINRFGPRRSPAAVRTGLASA